MNTIIADMDTVKLVAKAAAEAAAREVSEQVKAETRKEFERLEKRLEERLAQYFGDEGPSHHIVQHKRIDRLIDLIDRTSENVLGMIIKSLVVPLALLALLSYIVWTKLKIGI